MRVTSTYAFSSTSGWQRLALLARPAILGALALKVWQTARERRRLAELEPRLLRDMGIDPVAAREEAERPFWQLPEHHADRIRRSLDLR